MAVVVQTGLGSHFGVGEFTTHFRTYSSGDWDVHWGHGILTHGHIAVEQEVLPTFASRNPYLVWIGLVI